MIILQEESEIKKRQYHASQKQFQTLLTWWSLVLRNENYE